MTDVLSNVDSLRKRIDEARSLPLDDRVVELASLEHALRQELGSSDEGESPSSNP